MEATALEFLKSSQRELRPFRFRAGAGVDRQGVRPALRGRDHQRQARLAALQREGQAGQPVVLLPGHVDEVGFVVSGVNAPRVPHLQHPRRLVRPGPARPAGEGPRHRRASCPASSRPSRPTSCPPEERTKVVTGTRCSSTSAAPTRRKRRTWGCASATPSCPTPPSPPSRRTCSASRKGGGEEKAAGTTHARLRQGLRRQGRGVHRGRGRAPPEGGDASITPTR